MLGVLSGVIGSLQATEAIKLLLGIGKPLVGRTLFFDALGLKFREFKRRRVRVPDLRRRHQAREHRAHRLPGLLQRPGVTPIGIRRMR